MKIIMSKTEYMMLRSIQINNSYTVDLTRKRHSVTFHRLLEMHMVRIICRTTDTLVKIGAGKAYPELAVRKKMKQEKAHERKTNEHS